MARHPPLATLEPRSPLPGPPPLPFGDYRVARSLWRRSLVPWTLHRYIVLEVLRTAALAILAVSVLYSAVIAYQTVRSGIQLAVIWPFLAKTFAYPLFFSVPLALLFAVTLTVGRMACDLEVSAVRCHGGSYLQLLAPVLALGVSCALAGHIINGWIVPELHYEKRNIEQYILRQLENLGSGTNRTILLPEGGGSLFVGAYEGTNLRRVHIDLKRELQAAFIPDVKDRIPETLPENVTLLALEGRLEITPDRRGLDVHLKNIQVLVPERISGTRSGHDTFIHTFWISRDLTIPLSFEKRDRGTKDKSNSHLAATMRELEDKLARDPGDPSARRELRGAGSEWHRRLAFSLSGFTFPLVGAAFCFLLEGRRSRLLPFLAGNATVFFVFYPLLMVGAYISKNTSFPPLAAMALPNLALAGIAWMVLRKVLPK